MKNNGLEKIVGMTGDEKRAHVARMFDSLAARYDRINTVISFGQTGAWRKKLLSSVPLGPDSRVLDVGCGTGSVGLLLRERFPDLAIEGMDVSENMLAIAGERDPQGLYFSGQAENIPREDQAFDVVTTFYTTRNFADLTLATKELLRVLKPGGVLAILDTFPMSSGAGNQLRRFWMSSIVPLLVAPFGDKEPYRYLAKSMEEHVSPAQLTSLLEEGGASSVREIPMFFGFATGLLATR